jgi:hypothetical protein
VNASRPIIVNLESEQNETVRSDLQDQKHASSRSITDDGMQIDDSDEKQHARSPNKDKLQFV